MKEATMFEGFDHAVYDEEARERWGHTHAYRESARRTAGYGEEEWGAIRSESEEIVRAFASLLRSGKPATGADARAVVQRHREHISGWFYRCSAALHGALGEMYVADERFARGYERQLEGLAAYIGDAIAANAEVPNAVKP
jgi:MerR family transcriptional regulator, thiopeptide resistance regulator